jgi:hypothetical protein
MLHVTAALMSFRMVTLIPHHLPRLIGIAPANRVDGEAFYHQAAWAPGSQLASGAQGTLNATLKSIKDSSNSRSKPSLPKNVAGYIEGPEGSGPAGGMDSTLRATTDTGGGENDDV